MSNDDFCVGFIPALGPVKHCFTGPNAYGTASSYEYPINDNIIIYSTAAFHVRQRMNPKKKDNIILFAYEPEYECVRTRVRRRYTLHIIL